MALFYTRRGARDWENYLPYLLSFSGAYLLGIAAMELMPTVFNDPHSHTGVWVLGGFMVQLLLESLSQGVEHGHVHAHRHAGRGYAFTILLGLGVHALLEGLPLGAVTDVVGHAHAHTDGNHLLWGIVLHKIPAAFALALLLRSSDFSGAFIWACLLFFAILSPLGSVIGELVSIDAEWTRRTLALVVGGFLHISTTIIFEADAGRHHGISPIKFGVVLAGILIAYFTAH